jgi:hypothetical protein
MSHEIWSMVLLIGLFGWIASTLVFIFTAFPSRGEFLTRPAIKWGLCIFVSFMAWIAGLLNA